MIKIIKYLFALHIFKKNKFRIYTLSLTLLFLIVFIWIFNDILSITEDKDKFSLLAIKWIVLVSLFASLIFNVYKLFLNIKNQINSIVFISSNKKETKHKQNILSNKTFHTKGDIIKNKYKDK